MKSETITVVLEAWGDAVEGFWCDTCALPSAYGVIVAGRSDDGRLSVPPVVETICPECP